jgi:hypothetical protein
VRLRARGIDLAAVPKPVGDDITVIYRDTVMRFDFERAKSRLGKRPVRKSQAVPRASRTVPTADEIAEMASRGEDVSAYFTNKFTVVRPVRRVNVDLTHGMLRELDERAARLNVSRQAVIKTLLRRALDERP